MKICSAFLKLYVYRWMYAASAELGLLDLHLFPLMLLFMSCLITGVELVRSYTPVAPALDDKFLPSVWTEDCLCLMVKQYSDGLMSKYLCTLKSEDTVSVGSASGLLQLSVTGGVTRLCLLAGGSGFTPMVNIILWALGAGKKKRL